MKNGFVLIFMLFFASTAQSQILISLLFGDKLNSPNLEFGLEGGMNFSTISNLENSKSNIGINLGFYFDLMLKSNPSWMLNTGVIVKSPMGANKIGVYALTNEELNAVFEGGSVNRELRYFNVPILIKYKFENNIYVKAGPQLGLLAKAFDEFSKNIDGEDVTYKNDIKDKINTIDAGIALGLGYRITAGNGMNVGVQYYYGLVPLLKENVGQNQYNRSFYITAAIPIGKAKAAKEAAKKKAEEEIIVPEPAKG